MTVAETRGRTSLHTEKARYFIRKNIVPADLPVKIIRNALQNIFETKFTNYRSKKLIKARDKESPRDT